MCNLNFKNLIDLTFTYILDILKTLVNVSPAASNFSDSLKIFIKVSIYFKKSWIILFLSDILNSLFLFFSKNFLIYFSLSLIFWVNLIYPRSLVSIFFYSLLLDWGGRLLNSFPRFSSLYFFSFLFFSSSWGLKNSASMFFPLLWKVKTRRGWEHRHEQTAIKEKRQGTETCMGVAYRWEPAEAAAPSADDY